MMENNLALREKRTATRYPVCLFVEFESGSGWTLDVSTTGALIETHQPFLYGAAIAFTVQISNQHDGATRLYCQGVVVRVEQQGEVWRVGVYMELVRFCG